MEFCGFQLIGLIATKFVTFFISAIISTYRSIFHLFIAIFILNLCCLNRLKIQMQTLGSSLNYRKEKHRVYVYIVAWIAIYLVFCFASLWIYLGQYSVKSLVVVFSSYFLLNNVLGSLMSIYSFFLLSVRQRYILLNENLRYVCHKICH